MGSDQLFPRLPGSSGDVAVSLFLQNQKNLKTLRDIPSTLLHALANSAEKHIVKNMVQLCIVGESFHSESGVWSVRVGFGDNEYHTTLRNPFSEDEEADLEWYFEKYLRFPVVDTVRAQKVANKLPSYGEALFQQVFANHTEGPGVRVQKNLSELDFSTVTIEIFGDPKFQRLHWELLRDPAKQGDSGLVGLCTDILRRPCDSNDTLDTSSGPRIAGIDGDHLSAAPAHSINILMIVARPSGVDDVDLCIISQPLHEILENIRQTRGLPIQFEIVRPGTFEALKQHLRRAHDEGYTYQILHFDLHGVVDEHDGEQK